MKVFRVIVFWALIAFSVAFLWREVRQHPGDSLWSAAVVVPVVLFSLLFVNRFSGARKRIATLALELALVALLAGAVAAWKFVLLWSGYGIRENVVIEGVAASILCVVCVVASARSFLRLRRLPT